MLTLGIIGWIIIGGLAGWISRKILKDDEKHGMLSNIIVGIIGGLIGGFILLHLGFNVEGGQKIFSFITCLIGSIIFLTILRKIPGLTQNSNNRDTGKNRSI